MQETRAARNSGSYSTPKTSTTRDDSIITEYERGTRWAGWALIAMFVFMSIGAVLFGW